MASRWNKYFHQEKETWVTEAGGSPTHLILPQALADELLKVPEHEPAFKITSKTLVELLNKTQPSLPPSKWFIESLHMIGNAFKKHSTFSIEVEMTVLDTSPIGWVTIPLFPNTVTVSTADVVSKPEEASCEIGVHNSYHSLIADKIGKYHVKFDALCGYESERGRHLKVGVPLSSKNNLSFTVPGDVQLNITPSVDPESIVNTDTENETTTVTCSFPPVREINIAWTEKIEEIEEDEEKKPIVVNVEQYMIHSVGEGKDRISAQFDYTILNGGRSLFYIWIPEDVEIRSVDGAQVRKWEPLGAEEKIRVVMESRESEEVEGEEEEIPSDKLLRVILEREVEGSFHLYISAEKDMGSTSAEIQLPVFSNFNKINRETGYVAVEARTNVEITELIADFIQKTGVDELPRNLQTRAKGSLLFGYRFLQTNYILRMDVKKHDDTTVLVSVIDQGHIEVTCGRNGEKMHRCLLQVRNTQRQFLRVNLPEKATLWSTSLDGVALKPSQDTEGNLMVPLKKGTGTSEQAPFIIEIVFGMTGKEIKKTGKLQFTIGQFDLPINYLSVNIRLPDNFKYSEFSGDLREVDNLSRNPISSQSRTTGSRVTSGRVKWAGKAKRRVQKAVQKPERGGHDTGVLPINVSKISAKTKEFNFERLLVYNESLKLQVSFRETKKPWFKRRHIHPVPMYIYFIIILLIIILYIYSRMMKK